VFQLNLLTIRYKNGTINTIVKALLIGGAGWRLQRLFAQFKILMTGVL